MRIKFAFTALIICAIIFFSIVNYVSGDNTKNEIQKNNGNLNNFSDNSTQLSLEEEAEMHNFKLEDTDEKVKLSKEDAINKAKEYYPGCFNETKDIKVALKDYENLAKQYVYEGENIIPRIEKGTSWIVTLEDVPMPNFSGRQTVTANLRANFNIIIDANTGQELGAFMYKKLD